MANKHSNRARCVGRGYSLEIGQIEVQVERGKLAWIRYGESFRELTLAEMLQIRQSQQSRRDNAAPLLNVSNELPGMKFDPPTSDKYKSLQRSWTMRLACGLMKNQPTGEFCEL
jgi:hypothetical protein